MNKLPELADIPASLRRRALLRNLFMTGSAAAMTPFLNACGNSLPGSIETGGGAVKAGELSIPPGPLANVGPLGAPDGDGMAIPEGFSIRAVARTGIPPVVGKLYPWHVFPDGGATYPRENGGWIYVSNSEVPGGLGGAGALVFDADGTLVDTYSILSGTSTNCAGGKTPWHSWLSCEEVAAGHVWETDPYGLLSAVEKPALGSFKHEAAVIDLKHRIAYLTEDEGSGRFYRWVADASDWSEAEQRLKLENGTLQVMNIEGFEDGAYPETEDVRKLRRVSWKDVQRPAEAQSTVREELAAASQIVPGTQFKGGEGLWVYELPAGARSTPTGGSVPTQGVVYWSTKGDNRIWALDIENQLVELIFDNDQIEPDFDDVDNVTVSPWGDIIVAEDLVPERAIRLVIIVPNQPAKVLLEATQPGSEFTGPAFSPDGSRLYFSSQRGPIFPGAQVLSPGGELGLGLGATYELTIPPQFRGA